MWNGVKFQILKFGLFFYQKWEKFASTSQKIKLLCSNPKNLYAKMRFSSKNVEMKNHYF